MTKLVMPAATRTAIEQFVAEQMGHMVDGPVAGSPSFRGGQRAADAALANFDVTGYAARRSEVAPPSFGARRS